VTLWFHILSIRNQEPNKKLQLFDQVRQTLHQDYGKKNREETLSSQGSNTVETRQLTHALSHSQGQIFQRAQQQAAPIGKAGAAEYSGKYLNVPECQSVRQPPY